MEDLKTIQLPKGTGGFLHPDRVLLELSIEKGMKIADFGCGHGYFTLSIAKLVGEGGKVFAVDVLKSALGHVKTRAKMEGVFNIETLWANLEAPHSTQSFLKNQSLDMVFLANILFQNAHKEIIITEANRVLKRGGHLVVVEWIPGVNFSPETKYQISKEKLHHLIEDLGFSMIKDFDAGDFHYGMLLEKTRPAILVEKAKTLRRRASK